MFFLFLSFHGFSYIPNEYQKLINSARFKKQIKQSESYENELILPGIYQSDLISFEIKKPFTSLNYQHIKSYQIDQELQAIALISNNNFSNTVLSDPLTSTIYQIEDEICNDNEVKVYRSRKIDIFSVLSDFKISYQQQKECINTSADEFNCQTFFAVGYQDNFNLSNINMSHPTFFPYKTPDNNTINVKIGGFSNLSTSYEINFKSIKEFTSKITFKGKVKLETGFNFKNVPIYLENHEISAENLYSNFSKETIMNRWSFSKFGINLTIDFGLYFDLLLKNIKLNVLNEIETTSKATLEFDKIFSFSTYSNETVTTKSKNFDFNIDFKLPNNNSNDGLVINYIPTIQLYTFTNINFSFSGEKFAETQIKSGIENRYDVEINFDKTEAKHCSFPYIMYSYIPYLCPVFDTSPVFYQLYKLIANVTYSFRPCWFGDKIGPKCVHGFRDPNQNAPVELPVFYAKEILNTSMNQFSVDILFQNQPKVNLNIKKDQKLNFVRLIDSEDENILFQGVSHDQNLNLSFSQRNVQANSYSPHLMTKITDNINFDASFLYGLYKGIECKLYQEVYPDENIKFIYVKTSSNVSLIQHSNNNHYSVIKQNIYDNQFSCEDALCYRQKNYWKLEIKKCDVTVDITIQLVNSNLKVIEEQFDYHDNNIFQMDGRNLVLQIDFGNKVTKLIPIDFDSLLRKSILIEKELYYGETIELLLSPYYPFILFDLNETTNDKNKSFIMSQFLESNDIYSFEINNEIVTSLDQSTKDYKYLTYHLKTNFQDENLDEKIYMIIRPDGYYPLEAKDVFLYDNYLIEFVDFSFEDGFLVFDIPLVRNRDYQMGDQILIESIFIQPLQQAYCPNTFHYTRFSPYFYTGCIDNIMIFDSTRSLFAFDDMTTNKYTPQKTIVKGNEMVTINLFKPSTNNIKNCLIVRIPTFCDENEISFSIDSELEKALVNYSHNSLVVYCERCSSIFRDGNNFQANEKHEITIQLNPNSNSDYYAVCSSTEGKFCIQKLTLNPNKVTLIKNPVVRPVKVLNFLFGLQSIEIPRVQLFSSYGLSAIYYYKYCKAFLQISNELNVGIDLVMKAETKGKYIRLYTTTSNNVYFPFSSFDIFSSYKEALTQLGLNPNDISYYNVRDEIFISEISAMLSLPKNPSSQLLYGLDSSIIKSIKQTYTLKSLVAQDVNYFCYCLIQNTGQTCSFKIDRCPKYIMLTPHEYNNFDVYLPENAKNNYIALNCETNIMDFYPNFEKLPTRLWNIRISGKKGVKVNGGYFMYAGQYIDNLPDVDCSGVELNFEESISEKAFTVFDTSSSKSQISLNFIIIKELDYKDEKFRLFMASRDTILNSLHINSMKMTKTTKQISYTGKYVYFMLNKYNGKSDSRGRYKFLMFYIESNLEINYDFCVSTSFEQCKDGWIPMNTVSLRSIGQVVQSYSDRITRVKLHIIPNNQQPLSDCLRDISNNHENVDIKMSSTGNYNLTSNLIIYQNTNISFEDSLNVENLKLQIKVMIGKQQNISLSNKKVASVQVEAICPEREMFFDPLQLIIKNFGRSESTTLTNNVCTLEHSTIRLSLVTDSNLNIAINQQFSTLPTKICLYDKSSTKCDLSAGLPIQKDRFNSDFIKTGEDVTVTIVDDVEVDLKLDGKSVIFKGTDDNKFSGNLDLSSDSKTVIENLDISDLHLNFSVDIGKNEISSFDLLGCEKIPNSFYCILENPRPNVNFTKKFADLNLNENTSFIFISDDIASESIISAELITGEKSASVKINNINPERTLCYYETDSSLCGRFTPIQKSERWKDDINNSIIFIPEDIDVSNVVLKDLNVYFTGDKKICGNFSLIGNTTVNFYNQKLIDDLMIFSFVNFSSKVSSKIAFNSFGLQPKNWVVVIDGYDFTLSFQVIENGYFLPDQIINDNNVNESKIVFEKIDSNTEIHFVEYYDPNSFCVYDVSSESICISEFSNYLPINGEDLWNIKLNSINEPRFIFVSSSTSFLPLQRFLNESIESVSIEVLEFAVFPVFLVPINFTVKIQGNSSNLIASILVDTTSLFHGKIFFNEISKIKLIPIDKRVIFDDDQILLIEETRFISIYYEIQFNDLFSMNEVKVLSSIKSFDYTSDSLNDLYSDESNGLKALKLTDNSILDLSLIKINKLVIFGDNHNLTIINQPAETLKSLFINESIITFDSFLNFNVSIFNSEINLYPFASQMQVSPDISLKYENSVDLYDGSSVKIMNETIIINNEEYSLPSNQTLKAYIDNFCSVNNSSYENEIKIFGNLSLIDLEQTELGSFSFNEFDYIYILSDNNYSNFSFNNVSLIDAREFETLKIDSFIDKSKDNSLLNAKSSYIREINLHGKQFYTKNTNISSLLVQDGKSLIKGVILNDFLHIDSDSSLIAHSSTFLPSATVYFNITSNYPLLTLVDSTFNCSKLLFDFDNCNEINNNTVLIDGFENEDSCNDIKSKFEGPNELKYFLLSCRISGNDKVQLTVDSCFHFTMIFTESNLFTQSNDFTKSAYFSESLHFTNSFLFSFSDYFSNSESFSESMYFTLSKLFTKSNYFSETKQFTKTFGFTSSNDFSETELFTDSNEFTHSKVFTKSNDFTKSDYFSETKQFTKTFGFTSSNDFSETVLFSHSNEFTLSKMFTKSNIFTESDYFSETKQFSKTFQFSFSNYFTQTEMFTISSELTNSELFTKSNDFTKSKYFTGTNIFTCTLIFSLSNDFSKSELFSNTIMFSLSNEFSSSSLLNSTNYFSKSSFFTKTSSFSNSFLFSSSNDFTESSSFSDTQILQQSISLSDVLFLTETDLFSSSKRITKSSNSIENQFSQTSTFSSDNEDDTLSPTPSKSYKNHYLTITNTILGSLTRVRSVSFSYTLLYSFLFTECINENGQSTLCETLTYLYDLRPYIIYFYSNTNLITFTLIELRESRRKLTKEQLIGISCGSAASFFSIAAIINFVIQKKYSVKYNDEYDYSDEIINDENNLKTANETTNMENNLSSISDDLDFWI